MLDTSSDPLSLKQHMSAARHSLLHDTASLVLKVQVNVVYKFGGSSVRDAERMREVADIVCAFPQYFPCVVLSAMGKVRCRFTCSPMAAHKRPIPISSSNRGSICMFCCAQQDVSQWYKASTTA